MSLALSEEKGIKHQKMSPGFEESDITRKPKKKVLLIKVGKRLPEHQNLENRKKGNSRRPRTWWTLENVQSVNDSLQAERNRNPEEIGRLEEKPLRTSRSDCIKLFTNYDKNNVGKM